MAEPHLRRNDSFITGERPLDVVIVGSRPIGAVFARSLVDEMRKVLIIDMGEQ